MATLINDKMVSKLSIERQVAEAKLALQIYSIFNSSPAIDDLRKFAKILLISMANGDEAKLVAAVGEERLLRVFEKITEKSALGLRTFAESNNSMQCLDATDCADLIRLAGCWVEKGGLAGRDEAKVVDSWGNEENPSTLVKDAYRPGARPSEAKNYAENVGRVWGDGKGKFQGARAVRDRGAGREIEDHIKPYMRDPEAFSGMAGAAKDNKGSKRAQAQSNVLKIDRLFGLIIGCDISGTTTDTVFALEYWGRQVLTKAFYLLPVATIVHNNHHSLIEVALSLALNGVIDYRVGFYTSLAPTPYKDKPLVRSSDQLLERIKIKLREAEQSVPQFVCFYERGKLAGGFRFESDELNKLKSSRVVDAKWLLDNKAPIMTSFPEISWVRDLLREEGLY